MLLHLSDKANSEDIVSITELFFFNHDLIEILYFVPKGLF